MISRNLEQRTDDCQIIIPVATNEGFTKDVGLYDKNAEVIAEKPLESN